MEVLALVGPTGTGKSHRASLVAHDTTADAIVDDGLLIQNGKIIAGRSAKREATRIAAVRRAIFADPDHAREVREAIQRLAPGRLLILGTSMDMVERIAEALELPRPTRIIDIAEIASPMEIRKARRIRAEEGKHVIPAPTMEVKRTFSGYLVDPIRFWVQSRHERARGLVIEKSVVRPTYSSLGRFTIDDVVVAAIAARACREVDGIPKVYRVAVEIHAEGVVCNLDVALRYGVKLEPTLIEAQRHIKRVLEHTTALNVVEVNIHARKLLVPELTPA